MLWMNGKRVFCGTKTLGNMERGSSQWLLLRPITSLKIRVRSSQVRSAHSLAFMMDMGAPRHPITSMIICFTTSRACQLRRGCVFTEFALEQQGMSADVIRKAFAATEEGFLSLVRKSWPTKPEIAAVGSCCLVGVVHERTLYVANLGDSCVVMGRLVRATGEIAAVQFSTEHNANIEAVRQELRSLHPDDSHIVVLKHGVWRVKGIIQVSRSIGDVYLKRPEFNREPLAARFRLSEPLQRPVLSAEPTITSHTLQPHDRFLIFASDGLWEHLTNQEAVDIVHNHPHAGSAKRLVKAALQEAAKKREMRYSDLKKIDLGVRRHFHDDITVIVVFLDNDLISKCSSHCFAQSIRAGRIS